MDRVHANLARGRLRAESGKFAGRKGERTLLKFDLVLRYDDGVTIKDVEPAGSSPTVDGSGACISFAALPRFSLLSLPPPAPRHARRVRPAATQRQEDEEEGK